MSNSHEKLANHSVDESAPKSARQGTSIAERIAQFFVGKKILILGFGREGRSTYNFLRTAAKQSVANHSVASPATKDEKSISQIFDLTIADARPDFAENDETLQRDHVPSTGNPAVKIIAGPHYLDHLADYDIIMKTPGISFAGLDISVFRDKITSQLELLLKFASGTKAEANVATKAFAKARANVTADAEDGLEIIGITGTKGKSTTSSLIYRILQDQNVDSILLGNIGTPVFDHLSELKPGLKVVLEMSSHQLEFMRRSPHIALLLNAYEEHLDHYTSFAQYIAAKCNIFRFQKSDDYFIYNADDQNLQNFIHMPSTSAASFASTVSNTPSASFMASTPIAPTIPAAQTIRVSLAGSPEAQTRLVGNEVYFENQPIYHRDAPRQLLGDYNLQNIMFALTIAEILGLNLDATRQTISEFKTLKHRLEFVREVNGVKYYDNSIGTVPMATIEAIKALGDVDTVIIGGMDRGLDYTEFAEFLNQSFVRNIICMPKTGYDIAGQLSPEKVHLAETLAAAVEIAHRVAASGHSVLLSPAAASYGFFKDFEEKGDKFQELVRAL